MLDRTESDRRTGSIFERNVFGNGNRQARRHIDQFLTEPIDVETVNTTDIFTEIVATGTTGRTFAAGFGAIHRNLLARLELRHTFADTYDLAGSLGTNGQGKLALGESHTAKTPDIDMIETDGPNPNLDLTGSGSRRIVDLDDPQIAVTEQLKGTHGLMLSRNQ